MRTVLKEVFLFVFGFRVDEISTVSPKNNLNKNKKLKLKNQPRTIASHEIGTSLSTSLGYFFFRSWNLVQVTFC
ncbi:hypothetical protein RJT34_15826 [Clitoria ternatea]|uniref:Uncharacterized protein n=1 Tax=Clitoria ternatea TaxID=43366 RepID=A0AAN9PD29_CLITE